MYRETVQIEWTEGNNKRQDVLVSFVFNWKETEHPSWIDKFTLIEVLIALLSPVHVYHTFTVLFQVNTGVNITES